MISFFKVLIKLYISNQISKTVKKILSFMTNVTKYENLFLFEIDIS